MGHARPTGRGRYLLLPPPPRQARRGGPLEVIGSREAPISLIVPMVIVDELERQKNASQKDVRWRSAVTLAVIERVAGHDGSGRLRAGDFSAVGRGEIPSGEYWIDVLFDLPGHVRLSINDDEIVDRAHAGQLLSGKPVKFLTYDTSQAMRARHAGIHTVIRLRKEQTTRRVDATNTS